MEDIQAESSSGQLPSRDPTNAGASQVSQGQPSEGKITKEIGRGDEASNSFIYLTIRWGFFVGVGISAVFLAQGVWLCEPGGLLETIKGVWGIFMPVITLALGYAFGKGKVN